MKKRNAVLLATAAAAGIYSIANGKGIFNKFRFKNQHDAISRYVDSHYPRSVYSPIVAAGNGWTTIVRCVGKPWILLYVTCSSNGIYIFNESKIKEK